VLSLRDRVLIGLALKVDRSFRALIPDCEAERAEALHRLKTMAECLIYFYAVLGDTTDGTARQLLATKVLEEEAKFLRDNKEDPARIAELYAFRDKLLAGGLRPLPDLSTLATRANAYSWYAQVYRMACEPAHIGDAFEFMPLDDDEPIAVGGSPAYAAARSREALWYGGHIMLAIMRSVCEGTSLGLDAPVDLLERWFESGERPSALEMLAAGEPRCLHRTPSPGPANLAGGSER
jgi:hypothetical protein